MAPQAQGKQIGSYALTGPGAGSDVRALQTVAVHKGDRYLLTGEKIWISLGDVAHNFLVFAWSDPEKKKQRDVSGISAFIVERGFKGFSSGKLKEKWGSSRAMPASWKMEEVEVPQENVVGRPDEGLKVAVFALDQGRFTVAAGATGLIRACRDTSVKYARARKTFGVENGHHQLVKEMIAQMESDYQASRLLWLRAGWREEPGRAQHARDWPGEVVCDGGVRAAGRRRRPDSRRQWLLRRVPGRTLLSELQGARDSQADAS